MPPKKGRTKTAVAAASTAGVKRKRGVKTEPTTKSPKKAAAVVMKECDICTDVKPEYRNFPFVPECQHDQTVCASCYERFFITRIQDNRDKGWAACACPFCGTAISKQHAQSILPRTMTNEVNKMVKSVSVSTPVAFPVITKWSFPAPGARSAKLAVVPCARLRLRSIAHPEERSKGHVFEMQG